ncbi:hypothetical protein BJF93_08680 [Xaviernesmea oryzae]|uniref:WGR domain-containing protein n=1 Tax=Xaviernesmea oryzae TaxID=464029 RepID=A0A1Q9B140_9HYPH|nr:WGR domain-containing protein [Xaviernesmea oryzae]OLP61668.1 hypothetical protein BJF93_08680 [Xaviernesmea oryzae]SEL03572.1 WGR domain-containing protein, predicted DNA-binding domain in MolR [Xaviernesmea oryzae]
MPASLSLPIHLRRIDPARNMARFYRLTLEPSLFGPVSMVREWGRIGTRGHRRIDLFDRPQEAEAAHEALLRQKLARGYRPCVAATPDTA